MAIVIRMYDPVTNEARRTYTCCRVPWWLFKRANRLATELNEAGWDNLMDGQREAVGALIVELFERQFGYDELVEGCSLAEMMTVLQEAVNGMREPPSQTPQTPLPPPPNEEQFGGGEEWTVELEMALVRGFGWSLRDIDETDVETLNPFIDRVTSEQVDGEKPKDGYAFIDQVRL